MKRKSNPENGIIYKATYILDNRCYVGQTVQSLKKRIKDHECAAKYSRTHFGRAIKKYGIEHFSWEILQKCSTWEELNLAEEFWIEKLNSIENGFNLAKGGYRCLLSEEQILKLSSSRKGSGNPMWGKIGHSRGKKMSPEKKDKISTKFKKNGIPWNKNVSCPSIKRKLSFEKAEEIRKMYKDGILIRVIAEIFGIATSTINGIINNINWKPGKRYIALITNEIKDNLIKDYIESNIKKRNRVNFLHTRYNISKNSVRRILKERNII